jgi:hypothetical protein
MTSAASARSDARSEENNNKSGFGAAVPNPLFTGKLKNRLCTDQILNVSSIAKYLS